MEHFYRSNAKTCFALSASLLLHAMIALLILWQGISNKQTFKFSQETDTECYVAHTIISSGQQQSATVLFQDEAPSGNDLISSPAQNRTQQAEQTEQQATGETQAPLDEPLEKAKSTTYDTFAEPTPTPQYSEAPAPIPVPQQEPAPAKLKRTTNKKPISMAEISRGFIKNVQQEAGYNTPSRDMKQLALQLYATKIWNIIKNSFLAGDNGLHLTENVSVHTQLVVTIDRSGKLLSILLHYPKHITALRNIERLIISRAHQAGLFPPLPAQVAGMSKTFSFPLFIEGQKGFHAYSLGYQ